MSAWARPGVKCVCVDNSCAVGGVPVPLRPVIGETYTIGELWFDDDGELYLILAELRGDIGCDVSCFRPLITKTQEQDVALFTHHFDREGADA